MIECTQTELLGIVKELRQPYAVFFYTPFCGTCKLGERMLGVVEQMLPDVIIYRCNINFAPAIVRQWEIRSVPCLVLLDKRLRTEQIYALKSVDELHRLLKQHNLSDSIL